jgi:hypothetical protein
VAAAASTATAAASATKTTLIPKIAGAAKLIPGAPRFARPGNDRKQAPHTRAMALLANNSGVRVLIARQQFKAGVAIVAIIFIERHGQTTYLSVPEKAEVEDNLIKSMLS